MGIRFAPSGFVGQFRVDCRTLTARRSDGGGTFGERLVALDRIAGSTVMLGAVCVAVWIMGQASPMTVLEPASATAATAAPELGLPEPETVPLTSAEVRKIQARLHAFGFSPGRADGIAGGRTLDALNRYRAAKGLERVSYMDRATVTDLLN